MSASLWPHGVVKAQDFEFELGGFLPMLGEMLRVYCWTDKVDVEVRDGMRLLLELI